MTSKNAQAAIRSGAVFTGLAALVYLTAVPRVAEAHKPSDSYLTLKPAGTSELEVRWDIAVRDLDFAIGIDRNSDGAITWGEVRGAQDRIARYATSRLHVRRAGRTCSATPSTARLVDHLDGAYVALLFAMTCPGASPSGQSESLEIDYRLLFDVDPQHRGIAHIDDGSQRTVIFEIDHPMARLELAHRAEGRQLLGAIRSGIHHIWSGYDHLLFLIALLLPSMLRRDSGNQWVGVATLKSGAIQIARVVTAFTVAHSLTLTLAVLGLVSLPSRLVESLIAASVVAAALNNLLPFARVDGWLIAFCLGLLHGFGFSAALTDAGLSGRALVSTLFGFNVGVELGQMAIVVLFVPLAFAARNSWVYRRVILLAGSAAITAVSTVWLVHRALV